MNWEWESRRGERVQLRMQGEPGTEAREIEITSPEGERLGRLTLREEGEEVVIEALCIAPERRGYGAGSEALALLLEGLPRGVRRLRAWAPGTLGLAVYFWIRHGFRPLFGPGPDEGIWFERLVR